jgi:hypothetical protein
MTRPIDDRDVPNMKLILFALAIAVTAPALPAHADEGAAAKIRVAGSALGSGIPVAGQVPTDIYAEHVADEDFHAPGVLPGHPTAAVLWPRVVRVPCRRDALNGELHCGGYDVAPSRGEYIYVRPVMVAPSPEPVPTRPRPAVVHKKPLG